MAGVKDLNPTQRANINRVDTGKKAFGAELFFGKKRQALNIETPSGPSTATPEIQLRQDLNQAVETRLERDRPGTNIDSQAKALDQTLRSNTFKPSRLTANTTRPGARSVNAANPDAQFERLGAGPRPGAELGPGKTITQNRFGEVGLFDSAGKRLDPMQNRVSGGNLGGTPVPAGQETSFMKVGSNPDGPGAINYTELFNRDAKMAGMAMESAKAGQLPGGFFTGPGEPGPGTYAPNSEMSKFGARRDMLISKLDEFDRRNPVSSNASVSDIIARQMQTKSMRDEVKHLDEQIFGRTELSNKIMAALIGNKGALDVQGLENQGDLEKQALDNTGTYGVREMMEQAETGRTAMQLGVEGQLAGQKANNENRKAKFDLLSGRQSKLGEQVFKYRLENGFYKDDEAMYADMERLARLGVDEGDEDEIANEFRN